ncbi:hypothetical protein KVG29_00720 [Caldicoprobacter algeriensis]|uniref:hypothetical protein n=1 Tax=Caldicoprobacter algeriensis TaxID=699281 RepID=UPI00207A5271|nr:hypothetical protein [Caldicoprobacter algeriensis]MCM8899746.1 hypothetical protein [Caldicoprobacter algeriensis]
MPLSFIRAKLPIVITALHFEGICAVPGWKADVKSEDETFVWQMAVRWRSLIILKAL